MVRHCENNADPAALSAGSCLTRVIAERMVPTPEIRVGEFDLYVIE